MPINTGQIKIRTYLIYFLNYFEENFFQQKLYPHQSQPSTGKEESPSVKFKYCNDGTLSVQK